MVYDRRPFYCYGREDVRMKELNMEFIKWRDECFDAMENEKKGIGQKDIMTETTRVIDLRLTFIETDREKLDQMTDIEVIKEKLGADHIEVRGKVKDFLLTKVLKKNRGSKK